MTRHVDDDTGRSERGYALRRRREAVGLSRVELCAEAGVGLAQLSVIEGGAVPRKSAVLERAEATLDRIEAER